MKINMHRSSRNESFEVTLHELVITEHIGEWGKITHRYEYDKGFIADAALCILEETGKALASEGWLDSDEASHSEKYIYSLAVLYEDDTKADHQGIYDRVHIPEEPWMNLIKTIRSFLNMFSFGAFINPGEFMNAMKPGEVKYCGVEFSENGRIYHYRTTDLRIAIGDTVIVPVGDENRESKATVRTMEFCRWDDTPYPLEMTKQILRKAGDDYSPESMPLSLEFDVTDED